MSREVSPSQNVRFGISRVARIAGAARSSIYFARSAGSRPVPKKRGPRTQHTDAELLAKIREVLEESPFLGEGHRKVWAQLRELKNVRSSLRRVLRVMRENSLLAPTRARRVLGPQVHDGTIITEHPDEMWGTDFTSVMTLEEGQAAVFIAVDHCTAECVGIHASGDATRFEALEPIRQGVRENFGSYEAGVAAGLSVRHDNGSQYVSNHFQAEITFLGAVSSPAFVRAPEGNGCAERFIRTLKEQILWVQAFRTIEELRLALLAFKKLYNERWLIERHGHRSPAAMRRELLETQMAA